MRNSNPDLKSNGKTGKLFLFGGAAVVIVALAIVVAQYKIRDNYLSEERKTRLAGLKSSYRVRVVPVTKSPTTRSISLVGDAFPYANVTLYSKVSGFLKDINVDKGTRVKAGEVVAVIESPELNSQYKAALADAKDKEADAERARGLYKTGAMSWQDTEKLEAAAQVAKNTAASLRAQKEYEIITAPFDGTVTARYADPGALVQSAATSETSALPIVAVSQIDRLRVYVYPDQSVAGSIKVGDKAIIIDAARPDTRISGAVSRTSGELNLKTRTLLVEIDVDNRENKILAGSSVQVTLSFSVPEYPQVPAEALLIRDGKKFVAIVTQNNRVRFQPISIRESNGKVLRIGSGLNEGELVAINLGNKIADGAEVEPIKESADGKPIR